jgi:hypothetical protein
VLRKRWIHFIAVSALLMIVLVACGKPSSTTTGSSPSPSPSPSVSPSASPSPTPSPTVTVTTGSVTLHVGATYYHPNDTIEVTLINGSSSPIIFPDHLTNCTVIQLQYWIGDGWTGVNKCQLMILTGLHTLDAGKSLTVRLVPTSHPWTVGLYQATLHYRSASTTSSLTSVTSAGFHVV